MKPYVNVPAGRIAPFTSLFVKLLFTVSAIYYGQLPLLAEPSMPTVPI